MNPVQTVKPAGNSRRGASRRPDLALALAVLERAVWIHVARQHLTRAAPPRVTDSVGPEEREVGARRSAQRDARVAR
jgi:hypothetical protein